VVSSIRFFVDRYYFAVIGWARHGLIYLFELGLMVKSWGRFDKWDIVIIIVIEVILFKKFDISLVIGHARIFVFAYIIINIK
jgi:hypothetical protein